MCQMMYAYDTYVQYQVRKIFWIYILYYLPYTFINSTL
jgi:hypothetical protein